MKITYIGNACVTMDHQGERLITDPWLSDSVGPWKRWRKPAFGPEEIGDAVLCFLSHAHPDHLDPVTLGHLSSDACIMTARGGAAQSVVNRTGLSPVELSPWEHQEHRGIEVVATPCTHAASSTGFLIRPAGARGWIYFAGDAAPGTPFGEIRRFAGVIRLALLPVGGSSLAPGPLQRHLTPRAAAEAACALGAAAAIPIHWGHVPCIPRLLDRFRGTGEQFAQWMSSTVPDTEIILLGEGESTTVDWQESPLSTDNGAAATTGSPDRGPKEI